MVFREITVRAVAVRTHDSALFISQVLLLKTCFIIKKFSQILGLSSDTPEGAPESLKPRL